MILSDIFTLESAKSKANDDYDHGLIPYVTSTTVNNGVLKYVDPFDDDKIFEGGSICISGLGYATTQLNKYLPKGNGGDSCTILTPKQSLQTVELIYYASAFNLLHTWRFSFGRKCNTSRIKDLVLPSFSSYKGDIEKDVTNYTNILTGSLNSLKNDITGD